MPEALRLFLFSESFSAADGTIQKDYALNDEQRTFLGDKIMDTVFNDIDLTQAVADLKTLLVPAAVSENKWNDLVSDFIKLEVWPLRELFGDELTQVIQTEKIRTAGWPPSRVILKPLTYGGAASEIASVAGFSLMGGQMRERLRELIISKIKGVRIDAEVRDVLTRQADFGGLGLDAATADKAIAGMTSLLSSAQIMSEDEYGDWLAEEARKKAAPPEPKPVATTEEEKEIEAIKARMPAVPAAPKSVLDEAVQMTYAKLTNRPADEYLDSRLKHVISSRLRDVRSSFELKQLLQRDTKVGGLGLANGEAEAMSNQIEEGYASYHDKIMAEEKQSLDLQLEEQKKKVEQRRTREAEEHAEWYREKVQARRQGEEEQKKFAQQFKQKLEVAAAAEPVHPIDLKEKRAETARFGELVPAVAAGAVPVMQTASNVAPVPAKPSGIEAKPMSAPAAVQMARPEVKVSKATAELMASAPIQKPRMEDVKVASPRLMGPVQELRGLTLSEFRRIAKDPEIALQKIVQKVEILGQESFERRIEGIKAFQESGLQKSYMSLVGESFRTGRAITELAEAKRAKGEDVPSPAELSAVISLNSKLHF